MVALRSTQLFRPPGCHDSCEQEGYRARGKNRASLVVGASSFPAHALGEIAHSMQVKE